MLNLDCGIYRFEKKKSKMSDEIIAALGKLETGNETGNGFNDKTLLRNIQNHQIKRISDEATATLELNF